MQVRNPWITVLLALAGVGVCLRLVIGFVLTVMRNQLPWAPDQSIQDYYLIVGDSYSRGFSVGFFLCFSLIVVAVVAAGMVEKRRGRKAQMTPAPSASARPINSKPTTHRNVA